MKLVELATYFVYVSTYLIAIPVLVGFYLFRYLSWNLRVLVFGLIAVLLLDIFLHFFMTAKNFYLYLFSAVDLLMYGLIFSKPMASIQARNLILAGGISMVVFLVLDAFFYSGLNDNGISNTTSKLYLVLVSLYTLSRLIQDVSIENLAEQPLLWIGLGVLIHNVVGLVDAFSKSILSYSQNLYLQFYIVWSIVGIVRYGCFIYAFKMSKQLAETR